MPPSPPASRAALYHELIMKASHCRCRCLSAVFALTLIELMLAGWLPLQAEPLKPGHPEVSTMPFSAAAGDALTLPDPRKSGDVSVEEAIQNRRSIRNFSDRPLTLQQIAQLLWAAQGLTDPRGLRAAPSAGATYPLTLYLVSGPGGRLSAGLYKYDHAAHRISAMMEGDLRPELTNAALNQGAVARAPATVVICARYDRTTGRYGERGIRYVHMEAGHAAQNLYLQAEALGLGGVVIGAFRDREVARVLQLPEDEAPLYLMPIGHPE